VRWSRCPRSPRPGLRAAAFAVAGAGAPPSVTLTEPGGGRTIGTPAETYVQGPDAVTLRYGPRATTYLLVRQPKGGDWTVSVDGGSSTVIGISTANAVPDPDVSARVTGGSASRVLRFRARRIPGQRIVFTEVANGIDRPIGATERSSGRIRFTPSEGAAGPRLVAAEVEPDGMPRTSIAVARFRTSGVVRPGSVGRVRARRKGSRHVGPGQARRELRRFGECHRRAQGSADAHEPAGRGGAPVPGRPGQGRRARPHALGPARGGAERTGGAAPVGPLDRAGEILRPAPLGGHAHSSQG
jgi:hypothetical protein